jgi:hypothetical protein
MFMTSASAFTCPPIAFFPSKFSEYFSVKFDGKTYELSSWEKKAIIITGVIGTLLAGIGILLGFYVSYCLRNKLVEQLVAQRGQLNAPQPQGEDPSQVITLDQSAAMVVEPVEVDERLITERVEQARAKIDAQRTMRNFPVTINGQTLNQLSKQGRHFIFIKDSNLEYDIPDFFPLALPKGIYCVYNASTPRLEAAHSKAFNQLMEDEFGLDDLYHLVLFPMRAEPVCDKLHRHQVELCTLNPEFNAKSIEAFKKRVSRSV